MTLLAEKELDIFPFDQGRRFSNSADNNHINIQDEEYYFDKGYRNQINHDIENAISFYQKALEINQHNPITHFNLAVAYHDLNIDDLAAKEYETAISINNDFEAAYFNLGKLFQNIDKIEAIKLFQHLIAINPQHFRAYNCLGAIYYSEKNYREALKCYQKSTKILISQELSHYMLGHIYTDLSWYSQANKYYKTAVKHIWNSKKSVYRKMIEILFMYILIYSNIISNYYKHFFEKKTNPLAEKNEDFHSFDNSLREEKVLSFPKKKYSTKIKVNTIRKGKPLPLTQDDYFFDED